MAADSFPRHAASWHADVGQLMPGHRKEGSWRTWLRNLLGAARGRRGVHLGPRHRDKSAFRVAILLAVLIASLVLIFLNSPLAHASTQSRSLAALHWAEGKAGTWYEYGGTGPRYDCSGLVYEAYLREGVNVGRDTYDMLRSSHLVRIAASQARRGDLAFYGSGHVELVTKRGTFGALQTGTRVGWHRPSGSWRPTMYFRVR